MTAALVGLFAGLLAGIVLALLVLSALRMLTWWRR
jgi:xanthosine utilization system XapX-like protein